MVMISKYLCSSDSSLGKITKFDEIIDDRFLLPASSCGGENSIQPLANES